MEDTEEAEEESSSWSRIEEDGLLGGCWADSSQIGGGSGGSFPSFAFAKDFWRSLMRIDYIK